MTKKREPSVDEKRELSAEELNTVTGGNILDLGHKISSFVHDVVSSPGYAVEQVNQANKALNDLGKPKGPMT